MIPKNVPYSIRRETLLLGSVGIQNSTSNSFPPCNSGVQLKNRLTSKAKFYESKFLV